MGVLSIEPSSKVPKSVLENVWEETIKKIKKDPEFNDDMISEIESLVKNELTPEKIINILQDW